jgi:hypothetical protein
VFALHRPVYQPRGRLAHDLLVEADRLGDLRGLRRLVHVPVLDPF